MPLTNRVTPYGELIATPEHGLVFGNRGCLHDRSGRVRRNWAVQRWISCRLEFRGRRRPLVRPGHYTALFFLDEATAFAAGHRPCAECRSAAHRRFADWWTDTYGERGVAAIDARLHAERLGPDGSRKLHSAVAEDLPTGAMIDLDGAAWLVDGDRIRRWTPGGYTECRRRPDGRVRAITPPALTALLAAGWVSDLPLICAP